VFEHRKCIKIKKSIPPPDPAGGAYSTPPNPLAVQMFNSFVRKMALLTRSNKSTYTVIARFSFVCTYGHLNLTKCEQLEDKIVIVALAKKTTGLGFGLDDLDF